MTERHGIEAKDCTIGLDVRFTIAQEDEDENADVDGDEEWVDREEEDTTRDDSEDLF